MPAMRIADMWQRNAPVTFCAFTSEKILRRSCISKKWVANEVNIRRALPNVDRGVKCPWVQEACRRA